MSKGGLGSSIDPSTQTTSREVTGLNDSSGQGSDGDKAGGGSGGGGGGGDGGGSEEPMRKRRAPGTVSGRACNECRQARQKVSDAVARHAPFGRSFPGWQLVHR